MYYTLRRGLPWVSRALLIVVALCASLAILPAQALLQITSPTNGTVVHPGDTINIAITGTGTTFTAVAVFGWDPLGFCPMPAGPPFQCSMQIPLDVDPGTLELIAVGVDASGMETDSAPITLDVERADSPVSVTAIPSALTGLRVGDNIGLRVVGTYGDGSTDELTKSTQTTYVSQSTAIVTVSSDGLVTAIGPGSTQIVINGGSLLVAVTVDPPITMTPTLATLTASQTRNFVARVTNPVNPGVTWSLNPSIGSVDANGLYTAPVAVTS